MCCGSLEEVEEWDYVHVFNLDGIRVFNLFAHKPNYVLMIILNQPEIHDSYHSLHKFNECEYSLFFFGKIKPKFSIFLL